MREHSTGQRKENSWATTGTVALTLGLGAIVLCGYMSIYERNRKAPTNEQAAITPDATPEEKNEGDEVKVSEIVKITDGYGYYLIPIGEKDSCRIANDGLLQLEKIMPNNMLVIRCLDTGNIMPPDACWPKRHTFLLRKELYLQMREDQHLL